MKRINREAIQRMVDARGGKAVGTSGGGGGSLAGYATQAWVNEGFVSIEFFNRLFTVYGPGETSSDPDVVIAPNDLDSTIKNIKAMFGLWTEQYLSALGLNPGGTGSATSLSMLDDVDITTPTNGQALVYNSTSLKWENATISTVTALANLTDVLLTSPAANQFLMYDGTSAKWINSAIKTINGQSLYGSGDISVGGGASGNYLPLAGGTLVGDVTTTAKIILSQSYGLYIGPASSGVRKIYGADSSNGTYTRMASYAMIPDNDSDDCWQVRPWNGGYGDSYMTVMHGGKIGMGTNSPTHDLHVNGVARVKNIIIGNQDDQINGYGSTSIHLNYNNGGHVSLCGGSSGRVGVGTTSPTWKLDVRGDIYTNSFLCVDTGDTHRIVNDMHSAASFCVGQYDDDAMWFGRDTTGKIGWIQCSYKAAASGLYNLSLNPLGGKVGVLTTSPSYTLHVNGTIYATGNITALSDINQKNIKEYMQLGIDEVANAPVIKFTWKEQTKDNKGLHVGSIAQYWEKVLPEAVKRDKEGTLSMSYGVVALVAAISTAKKVQEHERRIAELERENKELKGRLKIA